MENEFQRVWESWRMSFCVDRVRGYHVHKATWATVVGEELVCRRESQCLIFSHINIHVLA